MGESGSVVWEVARGQAVEQSEKIARAFEYSDAFLIENAEKIAPKVRGCLFLQN